MLDAEKITMMLINERRKRPAVLPNFQSCSLASDRLCRTVEMQQFPS